MRAQAAARTPAFPVKETPNRPIDVVRPTRPPAIWAKVARIEELKGQWIGGTRLSPQILGRLKRSVLVTSTGASTRIEGARLSDDDVEKLVRGIAIQKFADRDKQEVQGCFELLQNVFDAYGGIRFSESSIKHLHKELLKFVEKDKRHLGEYKKTENAVQMVDASGRAVGTIFETTPAYLTPKEMRELSEWTAAALRDRLRRTTWSAGALSSWRR